ncbi:MULTISPECIES: thioredoxin domain-containing protein [unclassified Micromonospora]|uniref:thioredoxin domain-containing protein n=1 Tax=unclassified Micromonospora TaxID=2617518 RepID=UPI001C24CFCE|nr:MULTISPECIES: thioredoxin domain-containing protein [unclassified Micromonospora]MBU8859194.1 thioredoxin domain-containing protein [Micromonospora sp. WMMB482]MDM4778703.1 thioredoxin domain-containing protein [Micromonospora sp. b486]
MSSRKGRKDAARVVREQIAREKRRKRTLWTSIAAVLVLVIAGGIGWAVYSSQKSDEFTAPPGANDAGTGIVLGTGPVTIDLYEDYLCPACKQFQQVNGETLNQLVDEGKVKLVFHPVAFLNRFSTTEYSTRSSAASGCAAEGGKFREFTEQLFDRQPPEGGAGLSNDELVDIGAGVGLNRDEFASCVSDGTYRPWTEHVTDEASKAGVTGTPTIKVNGSELQDRSPEGIRSAVEAAGK